MSEFTPKKIDLSTINGGKRLENGSGYTPETFNAPIEASAFAQALATNQPNVERANQVGTPSVTIETLPDGTPRLVFENLKGEKGEQGEQGEVGSTALPDNVMFTDTAQTVGGEKVFEKKVTAPSYYLTGVTNQVLYFSSSGGVVIGDKDELCRLRGSGTRPKYQRGGASVTDIALTSDIPTQEDFVTQVISSSDGLSHTRIWNSGLMEQWGTVVSGTTTNEIKFPFAFSSTAYALTIGQRGETSTAGYSAGIQVGSKLTNGFTAIGIHTATSEANYIDWYAIGYI